MIRTALAGGPTAAASGPATRALGAVEVTAVATRDDERAFQTLPYDLYRGDPNWVPPLRFEESRRWALRHSASLRYRWFRRFVARRGDRVVGRIAAIIDPEFGRRWEPGCGFFGFFECESDPVAASLLLRTAEGALAEQAMTRALGPVNLTTHDETGFLVDGFGSPAMVLSPYNPAYYREYVERAGYEAEREYHSYLWTPAHAPAPAVARLAAGAAAGRGFAAGIAIRPLDLRRWSSEIRKFFGLYNASFAGLWGSVPIRWDEFLERSNRFRPFLRPELALFAEKDGMPIGCALTLPDVNELLRRVGGNLLPFGWFELARGAGRIRTARTMILGVRPGYTGRGAAALLALESAAALGRLGFERAELSLVQGGNDRMRRVIEAFGCPRIKTFRLYSKRIAPGTEPRSGSLS
jgi:Acetyltransferase (GNAT) family